VAHALLPNLAIMGKGGKEKGERGDRNGKDNDSHFGKGEKGGKSHGDYYQKGGEKGGEKGGKRSKGQGKTVAEGLRGKICSFLKAKPTSGFIRRENSKGNDDVYFDMADVVGGEEVKVHDIVEFDVVEGRSGDSRLYAARIKKLPPDTPMKEDKPSLKLTGPNSLTGPSLTSAPAGSLTGAPAGSLTGASTRLSGKKPGGALTGGVSLRPGGALTLGPGGKLSSGANTDKENGKNQEDRSGNFDDKSSKGQDTGGGDDGLKWGRIVKTHAAYGFLQPLGNFEKGIDIFFRAADVVGMNDVAPGQDEGNGLQITVPFGRNSHGHRFFWLNPDDEVSYMMSKDNKGNPCAIQICKERKGAWRMARERRSSDQPQRESLKDKVKRLMAMETDQVLQNASLFKEVLESPDFNPSHLYKIISLLASKELADDSRSETLYRLFLHSKTMQASLRTTIIKQSQGAKHCGTFLEECLRLFTELVMRSPSPSDLRGQLPLREIVEAMESSVREGSSMTKKGLPEDVVQMLTCLQKNFPDEVNLARVLGARAPKVNRTVAEDPTELMEADFYQDMPILPVSEEMLDQCAFEIQENMRTYEKCEDFIQTHFMLLREDYIEPLRTGIKQFMLGQHSPKDLHVYTGVKVVGFISSWEGLVYRVELQKDQLKRINWEKTKQLMYGSLLCLSEDNFETLLWATVWRRDEHLIANEAQLDIRLPFEPFDDRLCPGKTYSCIENVTIYFEAYRHVLVALQNMRPGDVPFQNTLLQMRPEAQPPSFLTADNDMWQFNSVFWNCMKEDSPIACPKSFNILQEWPETLQQSLDIDPSQLEAIHHALTHQVALIQGPPGTGKTWVGLKIVQAILDNTKNSRNSPILVVCYTNHALDQFLEGIFKFCERIARIGSRSKSEQLKERNLKELVNEIQPSKEYYQARRALNDRRDTLRENFTKVCKTVNKHVVDLADFQASFTDQQMERFYSGYREYLGDNKKVLASLPEDPDDLEEEQWEEMMKAWLEVHDLEKIVKPLLNNGSDKANKKGLEQMSAEESGTWEELAYDDQGEEEADNMRHDRALDVEVLGEQEKKKPMDFFLELRNAWLPYEEDLPARISLLQGDDWKDEEFWSMAIPLRREAYRKMLLQVHHEAREEIPELAHFLERNAEQRAALERDRKLALLREMSVVGMTTTAVSKYQVLLKELRPEIVVVEEAAEVLEAHILTALHPRTNHVVLIGDHQQLRPSTAVYRLSKNFHLDVSLFERLIRNGNDHVTLLQQRRMHPSISRLVKPLYPDLRDHNSVNEYPEVMGVDARCFFLTHGHLEDAEGESHSKENSFEVNMIAALCSHLIKSGYEESRITVLSPYLGQVRCLKNRLRRDINTCGIQVTAVDNFQGEENDIIVISLVRSNRTKTMGFLSVENRINVALTRARHGMFIVGNSDMLHGHTLWRNIMDTLRSDGSFGDRMPLVDSESGAVVKVKSPDEIHALLLGDDADDFGRGNRSSGDGKAPSQVADRWAGLDQDDPPAADAGGKGRKRGKDNNGPRGKDRRYDDDRHRSGDAQGSSRGGNDGHWPQSRSMARAEDDAEEVDRPPPPSRVEADAIGEGGERVNGKEEEGEDGAAARKGKASKKQKQKSGNKVLMRWG